jgi:hypothetical protein
MNLKNILKEDKNTTIEKATLIEITKKTVRFGNYVYQFRNVAGFGVAEIRKNIPIGTVLVLFALGLILANIPNLRMWGILMVLVALGILITEVLTPKRYGFKLSINSGENKIFITSDIEGIKKIVLTLYEFMENNEEGTYVVNIDQSQASIGVGYAENFYG